MCIFCCINSFLKCLCGLTQFLFCYIFFVQNCCCCVNSFLKCGLCSFRILTCFCSLCHSIQKCLCLTDQFLKTFCCGFGTFDGNGYRNRLFVKFLKDCIIRMFCSSFSVKFTAEYRRNRNLCVGFSSCYNKVLMAYYGIVGRFEFVVSCTFHFPWICKLIVRNNTLAGLVIKIIDPFRISVFSKNHFLEWM